MMENMPVSGYNEVEHTADWELDVWAPDLCGLLEQSARGMYDLAEVVIQPGGKERRQVEINALDSESLLVDFLEELLWFGENENIAFDHFDLVIDEARLSAQLSGGEILSLSKEIKAVTYHNIVIDSTEVGLRVRIVFDV